MTPARRPPTALSVAKRLLAMQHGLLTRQTEVVSQPTRAGDDDFSLMEVEPGRVDSKMSETPTAYAPPSAERAGADAIASSELATSEHISREAEAAAGELRVEAPAPPPRPQRRFVTVEEEARRKEKAEETSRFAWIPPVLVAGALVALITLLVYALKPPTADQLWSKVTSRINPEDRASLEEASRDLQSFLERFPDDPRADQARQWLADVDELKLERRLERAARRITPDMSLSPLQRLYIAAVRLADDDPIAAARRLEALVALGERTRGLSESDRQCLELARRQLPLWQDRADRLQQRYTQWMNQQLEEARNLGRQNPEAARKMLADFIILWQDAPWAAPYVQQARQLSRQLAQQPAAAPQ